MPGGRVRLTRVHAPGPLVAGATLALPERAAAHVARVLRMKFELGLFDAHDADAPPLSDADLQAHATLVARSLPSLTRSLPALKNHKPLKKRSAECKIVRRKGRLYVINKKNPRFKMRQG